MAALAAESRSLGPPRRQRVEPATLADGTLLIVSGMGTAAAAEGARRLAAAGARALLSWGMAGGLDPALAAGTLVLPYEVLSSAGARFLTAQGWRERARAAVAAIHPVCSGRLLTTRAALDSAAAKALAFRDTAAVAVDMESAAVAEVASAAQLPFLAVRAIVDTASQAVPRAALRAATVGADALRLGRLLGALARAPWELPAMIRLARAYAAAHSTLAAVVRSGALAAEIPRESPDLAGSTLR